MLKEKRKSIKKVKLSERSTKTYTANSMKYPRVYYYKLISPLKMLI